MVEPQRIENVDGLGSTMFKIISRRTLEVGYDNSAIHCEATPQLLS
jgi:hypothetical protein